MMKGTAFIESLKKVSCIVVAVLILICGVSCAEVKSDATNPATEKYYVVNIDSKKIHKAGCPSARRISARNKREYDGEIEVLLEYGYTACGNCFRITNKTGTP